MSWSCRALIVLMAFLVSWIAWSAAPPDDSSAPSAAPLTNEDIVRMVTKPTPEADILEAIRTHPEAFDVSDDMVDELTVAGVPASVVAAMKRKHAEAAPPEPPSDRRARGSVRLVVTLGSGTLKAPAWADEDVKGRLMLPKENDQRVVKDLAVFLACATAEHTPDLWRSKSPLGQDMVSVVRHEMLAFVPGETAAGAAPRLTLPDRIEAEIDGNGIHDIILGVAARFGDRWMQLASARLPNVTVDAGSKPLSGHIRHVGKFDFKVDLTAPR